MPPVINPRVLLAVGIAVGALVTAGAVLALGGSDGDESKPLPVARAPLTLEQFTRPDTEATELLISLHDKRLNTPEQTGGAKSVRLRCLDKDGAVKVNARTPWPLLEEYGYPYPHIHQLLELSLLRSIRACRLTGPGIALTGRLPGFPPPATQ
jgi:hypothetical protein